MSHLFAPHDGQTQVAPALEPLERAIRRLEEGLERCLSDTHDLLLRDGLIKRLVFAYEIGYKTLRHYLTHVAPEPALPSHFTFQDLIRAANEHELLLGTWPQWREYRKMRGMTSEAYSDAVSIAIISRIPKFLKEISYLMDRIRERLECTLPKTVDLHPDHWRIVRDALRRHVPTRKVLAFGSRVTRTARKFSDLDLAVMGDKPMSLSTLAALDETLCESDLPFKVDIVDWALTDKTFRRIIRQHGVPIQ